MELIAKINIVRTVTTPIIDNAMFTVNPFEEIGLSCRRELNSIDRNKKIVSIRYGGKTLDENTFLSVFTCRH